MNLQFPQYNQLIEMNAQDNSNFNNDSKNKSSKHILRFHNFDIKNSKNSPLKRTISLQSPILKKK